MTEIDLRAVLDAIPISVSVSSAVRDADGQIVDLRTEYTNPASAAASGIPAEEQIGLLACEVLPEFRQSELFADMRRVIETGEPYVHEALFFEADLPDAQHISGTFEVEVNKFGDGLLSISRDISERKQTQEALAAARSEIERRRFADKQVAEINDKIIESLVQVSAALDANDSAAARRSVQETLKQASRIITDLQALPRTSERRG